MALEQQNNDNENKAKVLIVDDHPIIRHGLETLINQEKDLWVCGQAESAHQAMGSVEELDPDIIIVDISLKKKNGMELIKDLRVQYQALPILCLSMHDENLYAERVLRAGAKGYIMKQQAAENIVKAIREVLKGQLYISEKMKKDICFIVIPF